LFISDSKVITSVFPSSQNSHSAEIHLSFVHWLFDCLNSSEPTIEQKTKTVLKFTFYKH
jgi:hypothetical protein